MKYPQSIESCTEMTDNRQITQIQLYPEVFMIRYFCEVDLKSFNKHSLQFALSKTPISGL